MNLLQNRLEQIRTVLKEAKLDKAARLLVSTLASDELFDYWSSCCEGSERIPKILRYIKRIAFSENTLTARIDIREGSIEMNPRFYIDHILGPEDLLFILVHERNHLILHKLYPHVDIPPDYPRHLLAFAEDAYINAISRKQLPSTLPERFYAKPAEMLLTGRHNKIDWTYFSLEQPREFNRMKLAHQSLYSRNKRLLGILGEALQHGQHLRGYEEWMRLVYEWHRERTEREKRVAEKAASLETDPRERQHDADTPTIKRENGDLTDSPDTECGKAQTAPTNQHSEDDAGEKHPRKAQEQPKNGDLGPVKPHDNSETEPHNENGQGQHEKPDMDGQADSGEGSATENDAPPANEHRTDGDHAVDRVSVTKTTQVDSDIQAVVPLVQNDPDGSAAGSGHQKEVVIVNGKQLTKIPLPNLKPNDPIVRMILNTCELHSFRMPVEVLEESLWRQVDAFVRGVLSERATEKECVAHTPGIPFPLTRRDAFLLSAGEPPVLWQKKVGFERPWIDLYVDVSGSMNKYYPYIPFIYESLKHYVGKVFQFSTIVVQVDPREPFLLTTGGTTFNTVATHMLEKETRWAILVSDGKCDLSRDLVEKLKEQLEFFTYIKVNDNHRRNWEWIADQVIELYQEES